NGAAGGVGTFAVQIGRWLGATVTGVCSSRNVDLVRSLGADRVVDYTREDFTKSGPRYDAIVDCVGNHALSAVRRVLTPRGAYVIVGGPSGPWMIGVFSRALAAAVLSRAGGQRLGLLMPTRSRMDLALMGELIASREVTPVIDRRYRLSEVPDAGR